MPTVSWRTRLHGLLALAATACAAHNPRPAARVFSPTPSGVAVIGHRGAAGVAPENTMAAFAVADEQGLSFELDVTLSEDGTLVVIHDDTLDRTTTGTGAVADTRWSDIASLDAGSWYGPDWAGEAVPNLVDVLSRFGHRVPIDIEIKSPPRGQSVRPVAEAVVAAVQQAGLSQQVFVTSFNPE